jgi:hypothetical protein
LIELIVFYLWVEGGVEPPFILLLILEFGAAGKSLALYGHKIEINSTWTGV